MRRPGSSDRLLVSGATTSQNTAHAVFNHPPPPVAQSTSLQAQAAVAAAAGRRAAAAGSVGSRPESQPTAAVQWRGLTSL